MKKKLFGNQISCSCSYCAHGTLVQGDMVCRKNKAIKSNGACRWFSYDPLKRVPRPAPKLPEYNPEDFSL